MRQQAQLRPRTNTRNRDEASGQNFQVAEKKQMSRTAQDVLEFDKLRELLRLRTTCAPGRRAVEALEFGTNRAALEAAFALIREAKEFLDAASLLETAAWLSGQFREEAAKFPLLAARVASLTDFRDVLAA